MTYDQAFIKRLVKAIHEGSKSPVESILTDAFAEIREEVQDILIEYAESGCDYAVYKLVYNLHQFRVLDVENKNMQFTFTLLDGGIELNEAHLLIQNALRGMGLIVEGSSIALKAGLHDYKRMGGPLE